jgi:hypothetical protein
MDLGQVLTPYVDRTLAKAEISEVQWHFLMLSLEDQLTENTRWLRSRIGFNDSENRIRLASGFADINVIWSPVIEFTGSLDNVGAMVYIYEGRPRQPRATGAAAILHEVVRQTSLQSRFRFPLLIINFNESSNASEVHSGQEGG